MIIALAGRRIDPPDAETIRFPLKNRAAVRRKLLRFFQKNNVTELIGSAACGADLLAQDAARALGIRRHVVLPFGEEKFRRTSVVDRPGAWGALFDAVCRDVKNAGNLMILSNGGEQDEAAAYQGATNKILELAEDLRREENEAVTAIIVWDGVAKDAGDETVRFAKEARRRNIRVAEILTM